VPLRELYRTRRRLTPLRILQLGLRRSNTLSRNPNAELSLNDKQR
jgi:hypothetical protein